MFLADTLILSETNILSLLVLVTGWFPPLMYLLNITLAQEYGGFSYLLGNEPLDWLEL